MRMGQKKYIKNCNFSKIDERYQPAAPVGTENLKPTKKINK
jgi:hypothetical protein